jgi:hypothetical protein
VEVTLPHFPRMASAPELESAKGAIGPPSPLDHGRAWEGIEDRPEPAVTVVGARPDHPQRTSECVGQRECAVDRTHAVTESANRLEGNHPGRGTAADIVSDAVRCHSPCS